MLGRLATGSEVRFEGHVIQILDEGNHVVYTRIDAVEGAKRKFVLSKDIELRLVPIYPIFYPRFVTQYILCELEEEIVIGPGSHTTIKILIPIDLAVYAYSGNSFRILDIVPLHRDVKYTLYGYTAHGYPRSGIVARYCKSKIVDHVNEVRGYALSVVTIRNCMGKVAKVRKMLFDASPLRLYYREGSWRVYTQSITMNVITDTSAIIYYEKPLDPKTVPIDDPETLKPPRISNRTDMLYGY